MFRLFNAATGLILGVWLFSPQTILSRIETPSLERLHAQLAAEHPREKLALQWRQVQQSLDAERAVLRP
jgi:hypothetical protein